VTVWRESRQPGILLGFVGVAVIVVSASWLSVEFALRRSCSIDGSSY
jgi:hypothetical protein